MRRRGVIFVIVFLLVGCAAVTSRQRPLVVPVDGSPQKGPENAQVTIVEFLDYT